jgi:hypothetical protein
MHQHNISSLFHAAAGKHIEMLDGLVVARPHSVTDQNASCRCWRSILCLQGDLRILTTGDAPVWVCMQHACACACVCRQHERVLVRTRGKGPVNERMCGSSCLRHINALANKTRTATGTRTGAEMQGRRRGRSRQPLRLRALHAQHAHIHTCAQTHANTHRHTNTCISLAHMRAPHACIAEWD